MAGARASFIRAFQSSQKGKTMIAIYVIVVVVIAALILSAMSVRIIKQYERVVVFELGKVKGEARGPGLIFIFPFVDRVHRVSLRIITMPIQSQGIITKDNVSIDVSAVAYYRVEDPIRSVVAIENVQSAISQIAQTTLRAVVGRHTLDETLSETDAINQNIRESLRRNDGPSAGAPAAQSPDPGRGRGRQELHGRLPRPADEHDRGARRLP